MAFCWLRGRAGAAAELGPREVQSLCWYPRPDPGGAWPPAWCGQRRPVWRLGFRSQSGSQAGKDGKTVAQRGRGLVGLGQVSRLPAPLQNKNKQTNKNPAE